MKADVSIFIYGYGTTKYESVELSQFIIKLDQYDHLTSSTMHISNICEGKEPETDNDSTFWSFVLNNKLIFMHLSRLTFDQNKNENRYIRGFEKKLSENNIYFKASFHMRSTYSLSKEQFSFSGENAQAQIFLLADYLSQVQF